VSQNIPFIGKTPEPTPGLGRVFIPDDRDQLWTPQNAQMRGLLTPVAYSGSKFMYWGMPDINNQGSTSKCVGHGAETTIRFYPDPWTVPSKLPNIDLVYAWAQDNDEWPGSELLDPKYFGTSVRAGLEFLRTFGFIQSYHRLTSIQQFIEWLTDRGPVIVGTNWYQYHYDADKTTGRITETPNSQLWGGHCYVHYGLNMIRGTTSFQNSHGIGYGRGGRAWQTLELTEKLLFNEWGDAYGVIKNPLPASIPVQERVVSAVTNAAEEALRLFGLNKK
jgi:hypothetical protein